MQRTRRKITKDIVINNIFYCHLTYYLLGDKGMFNDGKAVILDKK